MYSDWPAGYMHRREKKKKRNREAVCKENRMNKIIDALKQKNRIVLEMDIGILAWGILCQLVGAFLAKDQGMYARSLWFGIAFALVNTLQMYRSLDRALDFDEKTARRMMGQSYGIRYISFMLFLGVIMITGIMDALVVFLAYMGMKVAAFLQPFTHKLCNKVFHETDPVPQAMPEEEEDPDDEEGEEDREPTTLQ